MGNFVAEDQLENAYSCERCSRGPNSLRSAAKNTRISRLTSLMRFHIIRWSYNRREKIRTHAAFPLELDMRPYCTPDAAQNGFESVGLDAPTSELGFIYDLAGVVVHEGKRIEAGHYTAYCYNRTNDCWIHCNDTRVSVTTLDVVMKAQAYILFYVNRGVSEFVDDRLGAYWEDAGLARGSGPTLGKKARLEYIH